MHRFFTREYQYHRIALLVACGTVAYGVVRANTRINQEPPVQRKIAPELVGKNWINAPTPLTLKSRHGKVTMIEFWTFACSNCQANLPTYERWQKEFSPEGFTIIGVHTPELPEEYKAESVKQFASQHGITYPILLDNDYANWSRWKQEYWPAIYLIDKKGMVRDIWLGELGSTGAAKVEAKIVALMRELS